MLKLWITLIIVRALSCAFLLGTVEAGHLSLRILLATLVVLFWISAGKIANRYVQERTVDDLATMAFGCTVPAYRGNDH